MTGPNLVRALALLTCVSSINAVEFDVNSATSIKNAAATAANGLMKYYKGNDSGAVIGIFNDPYYWWEAAGAWGGLISYWAYTNDTSYNPIVTQALLAQAGPDLDYQPQNQTKNLGNEDQAFWALACMDAAELGYPAPPSDRPQWLQLADNVWNRQVRRWNDMSCEGGLKWQIFPFNNGYNYKNTGSNAAFFQLSARLARFTGNQTYVDWANKSWGWMRAIGLIDSSYSAYDGADDITNCSSINHIQWSYNNGLLLYGAAVLHNISQDFSPWRDRVTGLLNVTANIFAVSNNQTGEKVLIESACEPAGNCNIDQISYKAYLARWLARSAIVAPFTREQSYSLLRASAQGAAASCHAINTAGDACGQRWTSGKWDGTYGLSQQMAALDVIQSLLVYNSSISLRTANTSSAPSPSNSANNSTPVNGGSGTSPASPTRTGAASLTTARSSLTHLLTAMLIGVPFMMLL